MKKYRQGGGAPSYEAGSPTSPGSGTPPHHKETKDSRHGLKALAHAIKARKESLVKNILAQYIQQRRPGLGKETKDFNRCDKNEEPKSSR